MVDSSQSRGRRRIDWIGALIALAAVAIPVVVLLLSRAMPPRTAGAGWESDRDGAGNLRAVANVLEVTRKMELVTVVVEGTVVSSSADPSWRGTAAATVEAPVRYSFGVDLSGLEEGAMRWDPLFRRYVLTIPRPKLLASEVDGGKAVREEINVTGMRFKKLSGREQMILAQKGIHERALEQTLPEAKREEVARITLEQVEKMVAGVVGKEGRVKVVYAE